jgi:predicted metal-dependent peptidase
VNEIDVETANYLEKIQDWLVSVFPDQTSWNRPHRNHIWKDSTYKKGNYLPSRVSSVMGGTLAIGVDVSGSTSYYMDGFMSQIQGLVEQCNIEKVKVCWCSTIVHHDEEGNYWDEVDISAGESLLDITPRGDGGTELTPIFELVNNYTDDVADLQGLIVFTDGEFYPVKTKHEPDIPVLWATIEMTWGVDQTEFGEAIHLPPHCLRSDLDLAS